MTATNLMGDIALTAAGGAKVSTNFTAGSTSNSSDNLFGAVVVLNSSVDHSSNSTVFTITGTDADGAVITENITYALAAGMVHGTKAFTPLQKVATEALQVTTVAHTGWRQN